MTESPAPSGSTCPTCGAEVVSGARFCESCGAQLGAPDAGPAAATPPTMAPADASAPAVDLGDAPISAPTRRPHDALPDPRLDHGRRPCTVCGGEVGPDRYCLSCGTKAPSERDHFREEPASWVAGVCDKGVSKSRNEDAMALLAGETPGSRAVLVVLDGVSNSVDSDVASLAGARAAREVLRTPLPSGMGTPQSRDAAATKVLQDAARAAQEAIVAVTDPDSSNPASATFTVAVLEGNRVSHAQIGDSRAYWFPDDGPGVQLTVDDSIAQQQIAEGVAKEVAETGQHAHAITKWLGRDSEDFVPSVGFVDIDGPGWLLACSDGLWNYASEPAALAAQIAAAGSVGPAVLAGRLVEFANASGGHDNITAALARVGPLPAPAEPAAPPPPPPAGHNAGSPAGPTTDAGEGAPTDG